MNSFTRSFFLFCCISILSMQVFVETSRAQASDSRNVSRKSLWNHNGSTVILSLDGSDCTIAYQKVRPGLRKHIAPGATLFSGVVNDGQYRGIAHRFREGFPPQEYVVEGQGTARSITLRGKAPVRDFKAGGEIVNFVDEILTFEYVGPAN